MNKLCFIHHNLNDLESYTGLCRAVDRLRQCLISGHRILFVHISRLSNKTDLEDANKLVEYLKNKLISFKLLYISMLHGTETQAISKITSYNEDLDVLEIWTNSCLIDNGIPFVNVANEISLIQNFVSTNYKFNLKAT